MINRQRQGETKYYGKSVGACTETDIIRTDDTVCHGAADEYGTAAGTYFADRHGESGDRTGRTEAGSGCGEIKEDRVACGVG